MNTRGEQVSMDWYSWLSKTNLEQALVYKYGLIFVHNELQEEDLTYFNHEFLQSIGIGLAKHRVEILNLARKQGRKRLNGFWNKTKKLLTKNIGKLSLHKYSCRVQVSELTPYRNQPSKAAIREFDSVKGNQQGKTMVTSRNVIKSGPMDEHVQDKFMLSSRRIISVSGPLDDKVQRRITYPNCSPITTTVQPTERRSNEKLGRFSRSPTLAEPIDKRVQDKFMLTSSRRVSISGPIQGRSTYPNLSPMATTGWPMEGRPKEQLGFYSRSPTVDRRVQDKFMIKSRSVSLSGPLDSKVLTYPNWSPLATTGWPTEGRSKENLGFYSRSPSVSGPLDSKVQTYPNWSPLATTGWPTEGRSNENLGFYSRSPSVSGPPDSKVQTYPNWSPLATAGWPTEGRPKEDLGFYSRSPSVSEPKDKYWGLSPEMNYYSSVNLGDDDGPQSLWSMMFKDIKPT